MDNAQKTILITGASSGIGLELAKLFARDGFRLMLSALEQDKLEQVAQELRASGGQVVGTITTDLTKMGAGRERWQEARQQAGQIDVLVNDAGRGVLVAFVDSDLDARIDVPPQHRSPDQAHPLRPERL